MQSFPCFISSSFVFSNTSLLSHLPPLYAADAGCEHFKILELPRCVDQSCDFLPINIKMVFGQQRFNPSNKYSIKDAVIDLKKAFDTVSHNILLNKMDHYGIRNTANLWFKNYLNEREQFLI